MEDAITIKIKYQGDNVYEISISPSATVLDLKKKIAEKTNVQSGNQKVIFKGINNLYELISQERSSRMLTFFLPIKLKMDQQCIWYIEISN